jgi:hypothetical protein
MQMQTIKSVILFRLIAITILALSFQGAAKVQSQETTTPSDKPGDKMRAEGFRAHGGLINLTEGEVTGVRAGLPPEALKPKVELDDGDTIQTGKDGRVEILLDPGYYLRLFHDTEVCLTDLSSRNLRIKIVHGSAVVEAAIVDSPIFLRYTTDSRDWLYELVTVSTPRDEYAITTGGAYRFDVTADGASTVNVLKGVVFVAGNRLKDGMSAGVRNGVVDLGSGGRKAEDAFDDWNRERAKRAVELNKALKHADWYKRVGGDRAYLEILDPKEAAEAKEALIVSARSGFVSFVLDEALWKHGESSWQSLKSGDSLANGDRVKTVITGSHVEIHPYPTLGLYLAGDSEMVYSERESGDVSVEILKGSAVIVIPEPDRKATEEIALKLVAGKVEFEVSKKGIYRLNLTAENRPEMLVYDGAVMIAGREIKASKRIVSAASGLTELTLNKQALDSFDVWSVRRSQIRDSIGFRHAFGPVGGLWFLDESAGEYTFVPAKWDYSSPYGGRYAITYDQDEGLRRQRRFSRRGISPFSAFRHSATDPRLIEIDKSPGAWE